MRIRDYWLGSGFLTLGWFGTAAAQSVSSATPDGGSTGTGAAAGAIVGGGVGALVGAGIGAGMSTVIWLKEDRT